MGDSRNIMNLRLPGTNVKLPHSQESSKKTKINKDRHVSSLTQTEAFLKILKRNQLVLSLSLTLYILNLEFREDHVKDTNKCYLMFVKWFIISILNNLMILKKLNTLFLK